MTAILDEQTLPLDAFVDKVVGSILRISCAGGRFDYSREPLANGRVKLTAVGRSAKFTAFAIAPLPAALAEIESGPIDTARANAIVRGWVRHLSDKPDDRSKATEEPHERVI